MGKRQVQNVVNTEAVQLPARISSTTVIAMAILALYAAFFIVATYQRNGIFRTPVTLWRSAVDSAPNKRRTHENYGQALSTAGMLPEALQQFKTVLALPEDGSVPMRDVHREIGVVYFRMNLIEESIAAWKKGLEFAYMDPGLMNNISIALMRQSRLDEALSYAENAVRTNPYMPEPVNTRGEIFMAKGEYVKAAESFLMFIQLRPEDSRGYWNVALAFERSGQLEKSYQYASQFLMMERDPRYRQAAQQLVASLQSRMGGGKK